MRTQFVTALSVAALLAVLGFWLAKHRVETVSAPASGSAALSTLVEGETKGMFSRPRASTPRASSTAKTEPPSLAAPQRRLARFLAGEKPDRLTLEQLEPYLRENKRSAESLLGAYLATRDAAILKEAAEKFPNDPRVQFQVAMHRESTAEERSRALEAFKLAAPDNALGNYLSAYDHLQAGRREEAVTELVQAGAKPQLQNYSLDCFQNLEEACLAAGWSGAEAKAQGIQVLAELLVLPQGSQLRRVGGLMADLAKDYQQAGDITSAQNLTQMGLAFGQQVQAQLGSRYVMDDLVGIAIESRFLSRLDPATVLEVGGRTVRDRQDDLLKRKQGITELTQGFDKAIKIQDEREIASYLDRLKLYGELEAMRWFRSKHGNP